MSCVTLALGQTIVMVSAASPLAYSPMTAPGVRSIPTSPKRAAARACGERNRNSLYRVCFIGQSVATCGILIDYIRRQPNRELYRIDLPHALLLHAVQCGAAFYATAAARQVGLRRISGIERLVAWLGEGPVPPAPEAQGPALDDEGRFPTAGPFAWSRHPLNFSPLPILWLWPRMTTSLLAFSTVVTIYLVIDSLHEEARLRKALGEDYDEYQHNGVPFYIPAPRPQISLEQTWNA
jgi:hypothetical protein